MVERVQTEYWRMVDSILKKIEERIWEYVYYCIV